MFRLRRKKDKEEDNNKEKDGSDQPSSTPEEVQAQGSDRLVEERMTELRRTTDRVSPEQQVDLSDIPEDLEDLQAEVEAEDRADKRHKDRVTDKAGVVRARLKPAVKDILPVWVEKPFYYITPPEKMEARREQWAEAWATFLVQWADAKDLYIVEIIQLMQEYPFKNPVISKALGQDQLVLVGDHLVERGDARWRDDRKRQLRILWESEEETAEEVFQWAFDRGQRYVGVFDMLEAGQPWSVLPTEELYRFLVILVRKDKAEWADRKKEMIYVLFPV